MQFEVRRYHVLFPFSGQNGRLSPPEGRPRPPSELTWAMNTPFIFMEGLKDNK